MRPIHNIEAFRAARLFSLSTIGANVGVLAAITVMVHYGQQADARTVLLTCTVMGAVVGVVAEYGWRFFRDSKWRFSAKQVMVEATIVAATIGLITALVRHALQNSGHSF
jgi:predicted permease